LRVLQHSHWRTALDQRRLTYEHPYDAASRIKGYLAFDPIVRRHRGKGSAWHLNGIAFQTGADRHHLVRTLQMDVRERLLEAALRLLAETVRMS